MQPTFLVVSCLQSTIRHYFLRTRLRVVFLVVAFFLGERLAVFFLVVFLLVADFFLGDCFVVVPRFLVLFFLVRFVVALFFVERVADFRAVFFFVAISMAPGHGRRLLPDCLSLVAHSEKNCSPRIRARPANRTVDSP